MRSPVRDLAPERCDTVIVRENTESLYTGAGGVAHRDTRAEIATQESLNTFYGVERAVRYAFELARTRPRGHLTMVHKTNVLPYADRLWARVFAEIAAASPDIETDYLHVGAACLHMVASPGRFDVVVTDNLFGDIIADLGAAVQGGSRLAASANLNPGRSGPSMFEPIHGSAPDIAGTGRADPTAAVLGLALMLEFLDELAAATGVRAAVRAHLRGRTGHKSTPEVGDRLVTWIENEAVAQIEEASGPLLASACSDRWR